MKSQIAAARRWNKSLVQAKRAGLWATVEGCRAGRDAFMKAARNIKGPKPSKFAGYTNDGLAIFTGVQL